MNTSHSDHKALTLINSENGNLAFKIFSFENNFVFDHLQRQNYFTIILVLEGKGILKVDMSSYRIQGGDMMFISPYQPYMIDCISEISGFALQFHTDFFCILKHDKEVSCDGVLFNNIFASPKIQIEKKQINHFISLIDTMTNEMRSVAYGQHQLLVSYLKIFLVTASRIKINQNPEDLQQVAGHKEPYILQNLKDSIEQHYKEKQSVNEYAKLLNVSAKSLTETSKTYFKKTVKKLITERILIEAKRELYLTSKPVKSIAYELGFHDEHYFSRIFKKNTKVSPTIYRDTVGFARAELES